MGTALNVATDFAGRRKHSRGHHIPLIPFSDGVAPLHAADNTDA